MVIANQSDQPINNTKNIVCRYYLQKIHLPQVLAPFIIEGDSYYSIFVVVDNYTSIYMCLYHAYSQFDKHSYIFYCICITSWYTTCKRHQEKQMSRLEENYSRAQMKKEQPKSSKRHDMNSLILNVPPNDQQSKKRQSP